MRIAVAASSAANTACTAARATVQKTSTEARGSRRNHSSHPDPEVTIAAPPLSQATCTETLATDDREIT
jgi:hypothetical protein